MKKSFLLLPLTLLSSCIQKKDHETASIHSMLHEIQIELQEIKYQVNSHQMELVSMDEKLISEQKELDTVKAQTQSGSSKLAGQIKQDLDTLKKSVGQMEKAQEKTVADLKKLAAHADKTHEILATYKAQIEFCESSLSAQQKQLAEVAKLKGTLSSISKSLSGTKSVAKTYRVESGDSLEKIASKFGKTVAEIKESNNLSNDKIFKGQELILN